MRIYSRAEWGARPPKPGMADQAPPTEAYVHYSGAAIKGLNSLAKQKAAVRGIQNYHMDSNGWSDVGYAFIVCQPVNPLRRARVFECRSTRKVPAAQAGHNTGTLPVCVIAGPGEPMRRNTRYRIEQLLRRYPSVKTVGGHRDVTSTDCPGDVIYSWIPRIARASGKKVYRGGS